jgi:hypothetical protein
MSQRQTAFPKKWSKSKGKELLFQDLLQGRISIEGTRGDATEICALRDEYGANDPNERRKFPARLRSARKQVKQMKGQAEIDRMALAHDRLLYPEKEVNSHGEPRWDKSEAQRLLVIDIDEEKHEYMSPMEMYNERIEYQEYSLEVFRGHIYQEVERRKFFAQYGAKYRN